MEMHSYAKTRTNKKWTIEHKRKLVDNRITLDVLFNKKAFNLADSWKKLSKVSDMDCFDVLFVRKQWANILTKYKNLVQRHAINNYIDNDTLDLLTAEWEFFDKIHRWIKVKEKIQKDFKSLIHEEIENETLNLSINGGEIISSIISRHNNHLHHQQQQQQQQQHKHQKDESESDEPMVTLNVTLPSSLQNTNNELISFKKNLNCNEQITKSIITKPQSSIGDVVQDHKELQNASLTQNLSRQNHIDAGSTSSKTKEKSHRRTTSTMEILSIKNQMNETKRKHRKLEKKLERLKRLHSSQKSSSKLLNKKLNSLCEIFAKVIKEEYPSINVSNLITDHIDETASYDSTDSD